jgi:alkylation response protein AidB-like acyl-CoA dehydrogenase
LTDEMLARFAERAPQYDRDNAFFVDDFDELRQAGYLRIAVPAELGGAGLSLAGVARQQRRLGYYAAPTALAINMHLYWTGNAADLWRAGDRSQRWLLEGAAAGEVFAAGHAESGNDIPILLSTTKAERVDGGYRFTGRKSFGSLSPVWTYLGIHGTDAADPSHPKIVHAFTWPAKIFAAKFHAVEESWRIVDLALEVAGGFGIFRKGGLEQLFRDARLGRIHPANSMLTHEIVGKTLLGISPDETPRWG